VITTIGQPNRKNAALCANDCFDGPHRSMLIGWPVSALGRPRLAIEADKPDSCEQCNLSPNLRMLPILIMSVMSLDIVWGTDQRFKNGVLRKLFSQPIFKQQHLRPFRAF
jgi:hypothetical protein